MKAHKLSVLISLLILVIACTQNQEIQKPQPAPIKGGNGGYTPKPIENPPQAQISPVLNIISPKDNELIKNSKVVIEVSAENFKIVPIGQPVKEGEGHFHVWVDSDKRVTTDKIVVFENTTTGRHSIVAELVKSDHSSFSPRVTQTITINVESDLIVEKIETDIEHKVTSEELEKIKMLFQKNNISLDNLQVYSFEIDDLELTHVKSIQTYKNLHIFSNDIFYHFNKDGSLYSISGGGISEINISIAPKISEYEAAKIAYDKISTAMTFIAELGLWDLYAGTGKVGHNFVLVWKIMPNGSKTHPFALINANDRSIVMYDSGIRTSQSENQVEIKEFSVEADDNGFYPSAIKAKIGDKVKINFKFRDSSIYYAGLDIKGPFEDIKYKLKGEQPVTREFAMKGETKITSYWPASGVRKADLIIEVAK